MNDHWLVRATTIRWLWIVFLIILSAIVGLDLFVAHDPHFWLEGTFGFGAWFGFLSCVALIVFAKTLGALLKRADTYYDR